MNDSRDPRPSNSPILRILAGIVGVMMLASMIIEFVSGRISVNFFRAICQLIFAYVCIAYALGDSIGSMIGNRSRKKAPKDSTV